MSFISLNFFDRPKRGFTLIELLVVVAIIGILASVVLATLSTTRGKGRQAAIKTQFSNLRSVIAIAENDRENICTSPDTTTALINFAAWFGYSGWSVNNEYFGCVDYVPEGLLWGVYVRDDTPLYTPFYWCLDPDKLRNGQKSGGGSFNGDFASCNQVLQVQ